MWSAIACLMEVSSDTSILIVVNPSTEAMRTSSFEGALFYRGQELSIKLRTGNRGDGDVVRNFLGVRLIILVAIHWRRLIIISLCFLRQ